MKNSFERINLFEKYTCYTYVSKYIIIYVNNILFLG